MKLAAGANSEHCLSSRGGLCTPPVQLLLTVRNFAPLVYGPFIHPRRFIARHKAGNIVAITFVKLEVDQNLIN